MLKWVVARATSPRSCNTAGRGSKTGCCHWPGGLKTGCWGCVVLETGSGGCGVLKMRCWGGQNRVLVVLVA